MLEQFSSIMRDQEETEQQLMVCKYFLHGTCRNGDDCEYAHYLTDILPKDVMCEFYIRGCCAYGKKCWSKHSDTIIKTESPENVKGTIKWRFSFNLAHIRRVKESYLKYSLRHKKFPKSLEEFLKLKPITGVPTVKLPMEQCKYFITGMCDLGQNCPCLHGNFCDLCQKYCLDPNDLAQQEEHSTSCMRELERDLEYSFAIQCSIDKVCTICMEVVLEKEEANERRFGILEKCNHVYCLRCIREWRKRVNTIDVLQEDLDEPVIDERLVRSCPQCRVASDFVTPSRYWFLTNAEKLEKIESYKSLLRIRPCKYFSDNGLCPFGNLCFYRHALPDGTLVELPPPRKRTRRSRRNRNIEIFQEYILWQVGDGDNIFLPEEAPEGEDNFLIIT